MRMAGVAKMAKIQVAVSGAAGKMGLEVIRTILGTEDLQLAAVRTPLCWLDPNHVGF
jgi:hypothetical protein